MNSRNMCAPSSLLQLSNEGQVVVLTRANKRMLDSHTSCRRRKEKAAPHKSILGRSEQLRAAL